MKGFQWRNWTILPFLSVPFEIFFVGFIIHIILRAYCGMFSYHVCMSVIYSCKISGSQITFAVLSAICDKCQKLLGDCFCL